MYQSQGHKNLCIKGLIFAFRYSLWLISGNLGKKSFHLHCMFAQDVRLAFTIVTNGNDLIMILVLVFFFPDLQLPDVPTHSPQKDTKPKKQAFFS